MQERQEQYDVGVIIGRFQVHELHEGHRDIIRYVCSRHSKVIVILGLAPLPTSVNNPLDFEARKQMLLAEFPDLLNVLYVRDQNSDEAWSKNIDRLINDISVPGQSGVIYGGRDSFIKHYSGRFPTRELEEARGSFYSGTAVRKQIAKSSVKADPAFRAGVIWASNARFPVAYTCVDVAIFNEDGTKVLLGRKADEKLFRFIGGFSEPSSPTFEADAIREAAEETGCEVGDLQYVGSTVINDWRYRNEPDAIKTILFRAKYLHGPPRAGDDIEEVRWFDFDDLRDFQIMPEHRPLMALLGKETDNK